MAPLNNNIDPFQDEISEKTQKADNENNAPPSLPADLLNYALPDHDEVQSLWANILKGGNMLYDEVLVAQSQKLFQPESEVKANSDEILENKRIIADLQKQVSDFKKQLAGLGEYCIFLQKQKSYLSQQINLLQNNFYNDLAVKHVLQLQQEVESLKIINAEQTAEFSQREYQLYVEKTKLKEENESLRNSFKGVKEKNTKILKSHAFYARKGAELTLQLNQVQSEKSQLENAFLLKRGSFSSPGDDECTKNKKQKVDDQPQIQSSSYNAAMLKI